MQSMTDSWKGWPRSDASTKPIKGGSEESTISSNQNAMNKMKNDCTNQKHVYWVLVCVPIFEYASSISSIFFPRKTACVRTTSQTWSNAFFIQNKRVKSFSYCIWAYQHSSVRTFSQVVEAPNQNSLVFVLIILKDSRQKISRPECALDEISSRKPYLKMNVQIPTESKQTSQIQRSKVLRIKK
jgi:hypothetical protein